MVTTGHGIVANTERLPQKPVIEQGLCKNIKQMYIVVELDLQVTRVLFHRLKQPASVGTKMIENHRVKR